MTRTMRGTAGALALALTLTATSAFAVEAPPIKECPPDQRLTKAQELQAPPDEGAVREVLSYADVSGWRGIEGLALRIRRITVRPGGYVPLHYHFDRPSVDYIIQGELVEHNSFCAVPIVHHAGDSASRFGDFLGHWWKNETDHDVVLVSADIVPVDKVNY
ncbi:MAG: cupin domain-containing protein [Geminicoccaceae bacterium]